MAFIESPNLAEVSVNTACTWILRGIGSVPSVVAINPTQTVEECVLSPVKVSTMVEKYLWIARLLFEYPSALII